MDHNKKDSGYSFLNQGTATIGSGATNSSKHVLKRVQGIDFWSPSWGEETIIRIFPALDKNKKFLPYRYSNQQYNLSDWIRVYESVRNFGNPGITMLLHDGMDSNYDSHTMNPCWVLYRAINQSLAQGKGNPEWVPLTKGGAGKSAVLSKPSKLYLVQCAIYRHKSKDTFAIGKPPIGLSEDGPTIVMGLPPTAGEALIRMMEEKDEDWKGDPMDPSQYIYGDIVSVEDEDSGSFVHIYELGKDPRLKIKTSGKGFNAAALFSQSAIPSSVSNSAGKMEPKGYGVFITKTLDNNPDDIKPGLVGLEDLLRTKIKPWDSILEFKTDEEQAHLIAPLFPASAIMYAWAEHPSWIPNNVKDKAKYERNAPVSSSNPPQKGLWPKIEEPVIEDDFDNTSVNVDTSESLAMDTSEDDDKIALAASKLNAALNKKKQK